MFARFFKTNHSEAARSRILKAFPAQLSSDVETVLKVIPAAKHEPSVDDICAITVEGENLSIPRRIYFPEPDIRSLSELAELQQTIVACLYTRHHDGFVREKWLPKIINTSEHWTVPFVLQLTGEYIAEIIKLLSQNVESLKREQYSKFIKANPIFVTITSRRVFSYWRCYFCGNSPVFINYFGYRLAKEIGLWDAEVARRLIKSQQRLEAK